MSAREVSELLEKSRRSVSAAERLLKDGDRDFAVSRAYYAMFYAVQALLLTRGVQRSKHSGVIAAFNEEFVKTGKLPAELYIRLRDGFENRAEGDYGLAEISGDQARDAIAGASEFVEAVRRHVNEGSNSQQ